MLTLCAAPSLIQGGPTSTRDSRSTCCRCRHCLRTAVAVPPSLSLSLYLSLFIPLSRSLSVSLKCHVAQTECLTSHPVSVISPFEDVRHLRLVCFGLHLSVCLRVSVCVGVCVCVPLLCSRQHSGAMRSFWPLVRPRLFNRGQHPSDQLANTFPKPNDAPHSVFSISPYNAT